MPRFVAFLRAINVGGHVVTMERLRHEFTALGLADVATFIASGNVIFTSRSRNARALEEQIESRLQKALGYEVKTFIRTDAEVSAIASYRPFAEHRIRGAAAFNVGFLAESLGAAATRTVMAFKTPTDDFHVHGRELYWLSRTRQSESTFSNALFEKTLKTSATFRGINTVVRLAAKYGFSPK